jgi:hypothetical protein
VKDNSFIDNQSKSIGTSTMTPTVAANIGKVKSAETDYTLEPNKRTP